MKDIAGRPTDAQIDAFRSGELPDPFHGLEHDVMPEGWAKVDTRTQAELFESYHNKTPADRYDDVYSPGNWGIMRRGDASPILDIIASSEQDETNANVDPAIGTVALATTVKHVDAKDV